MTKFLLKRILSSIPVILGVVTLVFLLIHLIPGNPVDMILGENADPSERETLRKALGLDLPLMTQYWHFWRNLFVGGWGQSFSFKKPVLSLILDRFPKTFFLALSSLFVAILFSFPLGILSSLKKKSWLDYFSVAFSLFGMSFPIFVIGPLAVLIFSIHFALFPVAGYGSLSHYVLPSVCLGLSVSGVLCRMLRNSLLEVLNEDYIRMARSKGLGSLQVLGVHALRNALLPVITVMGNTLGALLAGAVLTETIFDWPGLGRLFYSAFQSRDYPLIQGIVLWISCSYVVINIVIDILYSQIDPRIELEEFS